MASLQIRRLFETWAENNGYDITRDERDCLYIYLDTRNAWAGFIGGYEQRNSKV